MSWFFFGSGFRQFAANEIHLIFFLHKKTSSRLFVQRGPFYGSPFFMYVCAVIINFICSLSSRPNIFFFLFVIFNVFKNLLVWSGLLIFVLLILIPATTVKRILKLYILFNFVFCVLFFMSGNMMLIQLEYDWYPRM